MKNREFGVDLVRIMAFCLMLWLHFYLRNGFYFQKIETVSGYMAVSMLPLFLSCVPMYMMLTGYLKCGKRWDKSYYMSLIPILLSWFLISVIHYIYRSNVLHEEKTAREWIGELLGFKMATYSWYIGMYIGLILISPIINLVWMTIKNKKGHIAVVISLVLVTFVPSTINSMGVLSEGSTILPSYFTALYPITYYVIGCYIKTYKPKPNSIACVITALFVGVVMAFVNISTRTQADNFYTGYGLEYSNIMLAAVTVLLFLAVYRLNVKNELVKKLAKIISSCVLEMYLISYIFDNKIYVWKYGEYPMSSYIVVGLALTAAVFGLSFISGGLINLAVKKIYALIKRIVLREKWN